MGPHPEAPHWDWLPQLCSGATEAEAARWKLPSPTPAGEPGAGSSSSFSTLAQSRCHRLPGVDDAEEFSNTREAMACVGIQAGEQEEVFRVSNEQAMAITPYSCGKGLGAFSPTHYLHLVPLPKSP